MALKKSIIALSITTLLSACGSGGSDTPTTTTNPIATPDPVQTVISGQAVKGVLTNAVVTVYKFVDGVATPLTAQELKDSNISTDDLGNYSFTVLDYTGPIKVELSPSTDPENPTTMTCDAPAGCGDIAFGDPIDLTSVDPTFKLAAISVVNSDSAGDVKVNVSALTHLATELIEASDTGVTPEAVTEKSAMIASTFGIQGDITQLAATVTTDATAVSTEDNAEELRLGLINAGIMSTMFSGETDDTEVLSSKLTKISADLVTNNGSVLVNQDDSADGFELAISDVLTGAAEAASAANDAIASDETLTATIDLTQEETNLANEQAYQEANVGDDGLSEVVVDQPTEGDAVTKAKAMVEDVRLFTHLFDDTTTEGQGLGTQGDAYVSLMNDANAMVTSESQNFTLLTQVSNALTELSVKYNTGTLSKLDAAAGVSIADYLTAQGATGKITFEEETSTGGVLFKVDASSASEKIQLTANAEFSEDNKSIKLALSGLMESSGATFSLSDGSFVQVNLDTAATREMLNNDSYQGKIVSGELDLSLSLAQKATDTVTNPVTFEGMLKTKLLITQERGFETHRDWDEYYQQENISFTRPSTTSLTIPETLSFSGKFSSLAGDSMGATLTVNSNNLEGYQAPDFKYIGKEISDVMTIEVSDDKNTIVLTDADKVVDEQQATETRTFISGQQAGEWTATSSIVPKDAEKNNYGTGLDRKIITKRFNTELNEPGVLYTRAYMVGDAEKSFGAKTVRITPVDHDGNGTTDAYQFQVNSLNRDNADGSSFETIMDSEGNLLTKSGDIQSWDTSWDGGEYQSIDEFITQHPYNLVANPLTVTNAAELFAQFMTNWRGNVLWHDIDNLGAVKIYFNTDELAAIAAGDFTELNPTAYLTQPLIKDAFTVTSNEDGSVDYSIGNNSQHKTFKFTGEGESLGNFESLTTVNEGNDTYQVKEWSETNNVGLDIDEVTYYKSYDRWDWHYQVKITPNDNDGDNKADNFTVYYRGGELYNDAGVLVYEDGTESQFDQWATFTSYDDENWNEAFKGELPFNPLTASNALDILKGLIVNKWESKIQGYEDGIGDLEYTLTSEELDSIQLNTTTSFDAYNTSPDSTRSLEDENTFLNINAALTLEAILGDYQVKLQLSGNRTALKAGDFDLAMSYRLPTDEAQRSFTVHYNTNEAGKLSANNFEGVVLVFDQDAVADESGTKVIGKILVGPTAIVAATIEDRDGLIMIVYSDETTESL